MRSRSCTPIHPRVLIHRLSMLLVGVLAWIWAQSALAQLDQAVGQWKAYTVESYGKQVAVRGHEVYLMAQHGITVYDTRTRTHRHYTRIDGLSGANPIRLVYDWHNDFVIVAYDNGRIDYFRDIRQIRTINDIFLARGFVSNRINFLHPTPGNQLYIATDFGVVRYDLARRETRATYQKFADELENSPILSVSVWQDSIWVSSRSRVFRAPLSAPNLQDAASWLPDTTFAPQDDRFTGLQTDGTDLYLFDANTVCQRVQGQWLRVDTLVGLKHVSAAASGVLYTQNDQIFEVVGNQAARIFFHPNPECVAYVSASDGCRTYWVSGLGEGLDFYLQCQNFLDKAIPVTQLLDDFYHLTYTPEGIYGAPCPSSPTVCYPGYQFYGFENRNWTMVDFFRQELPYNFQVTSSDYDNQTGLTYLNSWNHGLIVTRSGKFLGYINDDNSPFVRDPIGLVRSVATVRDPIGRLMCVLNNDSKIYFLNSDSTWATTPIPAIVSLTPVRPIVDRNGYLWTNTRNAGVWVYDTRGTASSADDRFRVLGTNVGGGNLAAGTVNGLSLDRSGNVWAATSQGVSVFYNTFNIFTPSTATDASCPVFEFRCLLENETVNAIAVDGANRKWVATNRGVILLSADGTRQLLSFNENNSPLLSDQVRSVTIDPKTGEVFFATASGLISYRGTATEPAESGCEELFVFPNPVKGNYYGKIAIQGTAAGARVRVTTVSGMLVAELIADGAQAVWDGTDFRGQRVAPGVYLVLTANDEGQQSCATKLAFVPAE